MMERIDIDAVREQAAVIVQGITSGEHLDLVITGSMLLAITALSLASIWRNRAPVAPAAPKEAGSTGMLRWITPRSSRPVTSEQVAIVPGVRRKSGSHKTIRVVTPVSKVTAKLIRASGDPLEIARRSGLSRDAVAMMMAAAAPKAQAAKPPASNTASRQTAAAPARTAPGVNAGNAMLAPGAYTQAQRVIPAKTERNGVGTRFSARVS